MSLQIYKIHLINGEVIDIAEDYDLSDKEGIVYRFRHAKETECIHLGDCISGFLYIPKRSILYISTGDVKVTD